jgi:hypothetical protein
MKYKFKFQNKEGAKFWVCCLSPGTQMELFFSYEEALFAVHFFNFTDSLIRDTLHTVKFLWSCVKASHNYNHIYVYRYVAIS